MGQTVHNYVQGWDNHKVLRAMKLCAQAVMVAACLLWILYWFLSPDPRSDDKYLELDGAAQNRFFRTDGREGAVLFFQTLPWVVLVAFCFMIIELKERIKANGAEGRSSYTRNWSFSTYPLWVSKWSPFGPVLTASELLGILGILLLVTYNFGRYSYHSFSRIDDGTITHHHHSHAPIPPNAWQKVNYASYYFGTAAIVPFSLLWVPVSRGSPLLRIVGIPFERAIRYHIWLSNFMVVLITLHSVGYIVFYAYTDQSYLIYGWVTSQEKCSVVAGLVAWILGLLIWFTSLSFFRRRFYDTFFISHHMYLLFSLFWLYHAVWNYHFFIIPILLFFVDRFLRMIQSKHVVQVLSARLLESGAIELTLPLNGEPRNDKETKGKSFYNALSTWCIQIPSVSNQQWHFFSTASSPIDEKQTLSIIIKPLGGWTNALHDQFNNEKKAASKVSSCPFSFKARVEGPYGDESDFYLKYKSLILIAGGIGITPLLAILRDILHRYKDVAHRSECLPTSIVVYHCIRQPEELCLLNSIDPNLILPGYDTLGLSIKVHVYITSQNVQDYNGVQGEISSLSESKQVIDLSKFRISHPRSQTLLFLPSSSKGDISHQSASISEIRATGKTGWVASTTIASIIGYFLLSGLANTFIVKSYDGHTFTNYNRAHMVVASLILGVLVFGGVVVCMWYIRLHAQHKKNASSVQPRAQSATPSPTYSYHGFVDDDTYVGIEARVSPWSGDVHFFHRPNWKAIFEDLSQHYENDCVGVLVSGSESMQEDIARECRKNSSFTLNVDKSRSTNMNVIYHYHSVSFNL